MANLLPFCWFLLPHQCILHGECQPCACRNLDLLIGGQSWALRHGPVGSRQAPSPATGCNVLLQEAERTGLGGATLTFAGFPCLLPLLLLLWVLASTVQNWDPSSTQGLDARGGGHLPLFPCCIAHRGGDRAGAHSPLPLPMHAHSGWDQRARQTD